LGETFKSIYQIKLLNLVKKCYLREPISGIKNF